MTALQAQEDLEVICSLNVPRRLRQVSEREPLQPSLMIAVLQSNTIHNPGYQMIALRVENHALPVLTSSFRHLTPSR